MYYFAFGSKQHEVTVGHTHIISPEPRMKCLCMIEKSITSLIHFFELACMKICEGLDYISREVFVSVCKCVFVYVSCSL